MLHSKLTGINSKLTPTTINILNTLDDFGNQSESTYIMLQFLGLACSSSWTKSDFPCHRFFNLREIKGF